MQASHEMRMTVRCADAGRLASCPSGTPSASFQRWRGEIRRENHTTREGSELVVSRCHSAELS